jgi:hypothetical protein
MLDSGARTYEEMLAAPCQKSKWTLEKEETMEGGRVDGSRMLPNDGNKLSLDYSHDDMLLINAIKNML